MSEKYNMQSISKGVRLMVLDLAKKRMPDTVHSIHVFARKHVLSYARKWNFVLEMVVDFS